MCAGLTSITDATLSITSICLVFVFLVFVKFINAMPRAHFMDAMPRGDGLSKRRCRARPDSSDDVHTPRSPHPNHDQHHTPEQVHARVPVLGTGTRRPPHSRRKAPPAQREVGWAPTPTPAFIGGVTGWVWAASLL